MDMLTPEYQLLRRLGRGGMGEVWEAAKIKDHHVVVPCAIKLLHADFTETARERKLFMDEARIATQLDHSRIVKVIDVGTTRAGQPFLVMERVDGIDLRSFLKEAEKEALIPLEVDITTYIIGEVLAALDYAHERTIGGADAGIIHSDVTPGNIMISSSGEVKLTDFGIARFAATAGPMSRAIGTPRYMSPEQLSGHPRRETDIYGLGVVLHEMLDGKRFLDGCTPDEFRSRVLMGPPPELERSDIPGWLDELRRRMIATDYRDRPRASEARAVLIEHCPRYLAAGEQLKTNYYARLIGRRRSGVTQLLTRADQAYLANLIPQIGQEAADSGPLAVRRAEDSGHTATDPTLEDGQRRSPGSAPAPTGALVSSRPRPQPQDLGAGAGAGGQGLSSTYTADRAGRIHLSEQHAETQAELPPEYEEDPDDQPVERTQLLAPAAPITDPDQEVSQPELVLAESEIETQKSGHTAPAVVGLPPADPQPAPGARLRWLAIGSAAAALALLVTVVVLLIGILRGGEQDEPELAVAPTQTDTGELDGAVEGTDGAARVGAEQAVATTDDEVEVEKVAGGETGGDGDTDTDTDTGTGDGDGDGDEDGDTGGDGDGDTDGKVKKIDKPKPKPKPKGPDIGVIVLVEGQGEGRLKIGRVIKQTKNRSAYIELQPGRYQVRWQSAGSDEWQYQGKLTVKDISPRKYQVRLDGGKLAEVKEL